MYHTGQSAEVVELRGKGFEHAWAVQEEILLEDHFRIVRVDSDRDYISFDQVVEEVRAEGRLRSRSQCLEGHFREDSRPVDILVAHLDTQLNITCTPARRAEQRVHFVLQQPVYSPDDPTGGEPFLLARQPGICPGIHVDDVLYVADHAAGQAKPTGKEELLRGNVGGQIDFFRQSARRKGAALEEIELSALPGEFDLHRPSVSLLKSAQHLFHHPRDSGLGQKIFESNAGMGDVDLLLPEQGSGEVAFSVNRNRKIQIRVSDFSKKIQGGDGPEGPAFHVEHIDQLLRVLCNLFGTDFGAQQRMAEGREPGVIDPDPIDGPGSETENEPQQPVVRADTGSPRVDIPGKGDSRRGGKEIIPVLLPDDLLDEHTHPLVKIQQVVVPAVQNGLRAENADQDLLQGASKLIQPQLHFALVHNEYGIIFPGKRVTEIILEKAR